MPMRLALTGISKAFGADRVLADVSLQVAAGEVRGLLGANGSGKSTLIKILAGVHAPARGSGAIAIDGVALPMPVPPHAARAAGLRFVHQDLALVDRRPVYENLALGRPFVRNRLGLLDWRAERRHAAALLRELGATFGPDELVGTLSRVDQAVVAIGRALADGGALKALVLDEPTAGLPAAERALVREAIARLSRRGVAVLLVSHSLDEVLAACDTVTVLRDGCVVLDGAARADRRDTIVSAIAGKPGPSRERQRATGSPVSLDVRGLCSGPLRAFGVRVHAGEICGVAGQRDTGADRLLPALYGALPARFERVAVTGRPLAELTPRACRRAGMTYLPPDRRREGLFPGMNVREHITGVAPLLIRVRAERAATRPLVERLSLPPDGERPIDRLSGGNQQKAVLARCLRAEPSVLLLQEPLTGIDLGTRAVVRHALDAAADAGAAVLVHSPDEAELAELCDRVIALEAGRGPDALVC